MEKIFGNLTSFSLCNIKNTGLNSVKFTKPSAELIREMQYTRRLVKLKLSKINLSNDDKLMAELCKFIEGASSCLYYDFSWTQMTGKELA